MRLGGVVLWLMLLSTTVKAADWRSIAEKVLPSVVQLTNGDRPTCSGTVIDKDRKHVLTDAHCFTDPMYADSLPVVIEFRDPNTDLMVLRVPNLDRAAILLAKDDPVVGQEVASYGHAYGWAKPVLRRTMISVADFNVPDTKCGSCFVTDAAFIGGQSGSPVVNEAGEMVMIVQMTSDRVGIGVGAKTIEKRVGRFFGKVKP